MMAENCAAYASGDAAGGGKFPEKSPAVFRESGDRAYERARRKKPAAPDLPKEAFQLLEEGVPQKIEFFEAETKLPVDIAFDDRFEHEHAQGIHVRAGSSGEFYPASVATGRWAGGLRFRRDGYDAGELFGQRAGVAGGGPPDSSRRGNIDLRRGVPCRLTILGGARKSEAVIILVTDAGKRRAGGF